MKTNSKYENGPEQDHHEDNQDMVFSKAYFQGSRNNAWANKKKFKKEKW